MVFKTFGHWATKNSDPKERRKNSPTNASANYLKRVSRYIILKEFIISRPAQ